MPENASHNLAGLSRWKLVLIYSIQKYEHDMHSNNRSTVFTVLL